MAEITWVSSEAAQEAIADVRSDKTDTDWCIISYAGKTGADAQKLTFLSKGNGGIDALKEALKDDIVGYCLLRETDQIDESVTVKFVFVQWTGENVPRMQKARISIHLGPVKQFLGQVHVDHAATKSDELNHELIKAKIMDFSGSGSRVLNEKGTSNLTDQAKVKPTGRMGVRVNTNNDQISFADPEGARNTVNQLRNGDLTWILFTYEDPKTNVLYLKSSGTGDVTELTAELSDDLVGYGLIKKIDKIDESETVKFCFFIWIGDNVNRMLKARLGTHKGDVQAFFRPYHVDVNVSRLDEITDEIVLKLIKTASGTEIHVLDTTIATEKVVKKPNTNAQPQPSPSPSPQPSQPTESKPKVSSGARKSFIVPKSNSDTIELLFTDEQAVRDALADVRNDQTPTNWAIITYDAPKSKTLTVKGTGTGGIDEMIENLQDDIVGYCLVRFIETVDQSETVKFVFVNWAGDNIHRMQRAVLSTHKGFVTNLIAPFHVDHECNNKSEVSSEILTAKIKKAAGTANYVLN